MVDVVVSSLMLVLLAPLMGAIALAVRLTSEGPILFRQRRIGQHVGHVPGGSRTDQPQGRGPGQVAAHDRRREQPAVC